MNIGVPGRHGFRTPAAPAAPPPTHATDRARPTGDKHDAAPEPNHGFRTAAAPAASPPAGESGQASVEFALVLPLIVVIALGLVAIGLAIRNELAVELAAREGARAAAVSADPTSAATAAAHRAVTLPVEVATETHSDTVTVVVTYVDPTDVAIVGRFLGPVTHRASVTMSIEPPEP